MKRQLVRATTIVVVLTAVAVSAYAMDPDYAKKAADTNPFYVGEGRSTTVSYTGGEAPHTEPPWDKGAVGYHRHEERGNPTVSYTGGEAPHTEPPWDKGSIGYHRHE